MNDPEWQGYLKPDFSARKSLYIFCIDQGRKSLLGMAWCVDIIWLPVPTPTSDEP